MNTSAVKKTNKVLLTFREFLLSVLLIYVGFHAILFYLQERYIYFPPKPGTSTPADYGLNFNKFFIDTVDGFKLSAWFIPQLNSKTNTPILLYCHGNGANINMLAEVSSIFNSYGWESLIFDYRAYGESSGNFSDLSEDALAKDAESALRWIKSNFPDRPVIVWGHSLGSAVAARLSQDYDFEGVILEDTFPSLKDIAIERFPIFPLVRFLLKDEFNTLEYLQNRKYKPVLIMHGEKDQVIPLKFGQETYDKTPDPSNWLLIKGIDHNQFPEVHSQYREKIQDIVKSWIY